MVARSAADSCRGVLLGLAAGDRIGGPVRMAVRLAESLIDRRGFDARNVVVRYLQWWQEGAFDTGPISGRVFELLAAGMSGNQAAAQVHAEVGGLTAGCNPAHRSVALAMCAAVADEQLPDCATLEARQTHIHPIAGATAAKVNQVCRGLIRGGEWSVVRQSIEEFLPPPSRLNSGGYAPDVLRAALYFIDGAPNFSEALQQSLQFAGPANYCPVLVGAIAGARWGAASVPDAALAHVDLLPRVAAAAATLAADW